jgi:hypothetical protein
MSLVFLDALVEPSGLPRFLFTTRQDSVLSCDSVGSVATLGLLCSGFPDRRAGSGAVDENRVISASGVALSWTKIETGPWARLGVVVSDVLRTAVGACAGRSWNRFGRVLYATFAASTWAFRARQSLCYAVCFASLVLQTVHWCCMWSSFFIQSLVAWLTPAQNPHRCVLRHIFARCLYS